MRVAVIVFVVAALFISFCTFNGARRQQMLRAVKYQPDYASLVQFLTVAAAAAMIAFITINRITVRCQSN